jgi:hypothetical protein
VNLDVPIADGYFFRWKKAAAASPRALLVLRAEAGTLGVGPGLLVGSIFCLLRKLPAR